MANGLWRGAAALDRIHRGRKPAALSLERLVDLLFALPCRDRLGAHVFASLLAPATNDCGEPASDLAHHATWRGRARVGDWRRKILPLVARWCVFCARWRVDDFPPIRSERARTARR